MKPQNKSAAPAKKAFTPNKKPFTGVRKPYEGSKPPFADKKKPFVSSAKKAFVPATKPVAIAKKSAYTTTPSYKAKPATVPVKRPAIAPKYVPVTAKIAPVVAKPSVAPKTTSWGAVAPWYDNHLETTPDTFQDAVIAPNLMRILELKPGTKVLDLACGQGHFSRLYSQHNGDVTGADISPELIAAAQKRSPKIAFHATPAHKLGFAMGQTFDVVTIILAIQNIENMTEVFAEANRVLKPGGRLVLVMNHPVFRNPKETHWVYDATANKQYRRIDSYLSQATIEIEMHPGQAAAGKGGEQTISYHRSLQDFFKALNKTGFTVARFEEWISHKKSQSGPRQKAEDKARKEIPLFLMMEAVKGK